MGSEHRYREFMEWEMPWYSVPSTSVDALIAGRHFGMRVCYLRDDHRVFENILDHRPRPRADGQFRRLGRTPPRAGRNGSSTPRPLRCAPTIDGCAVNRPDGRPISQWSRLAAGRSDDLGTAGVTPADHCH